ncbi:MAG: hypothetical protein U9R58_07595 [Chloroflexota bacterium]|nr:hypothetical protein [Chloroflexota bacterium]
MPRSTIPGTRDLVAGGSVIIIYLIFHYILDQRGMFFVMTPLNHFWQILDPQWLQYDLPRSLVYLHSQPPIFNALVGIGLGLFNQNLDQAFHIFYQVLAVAILILLYTNLRLLKVPWWLAWLLTMVWMVYPAFIYYQHFLFYPILVQFLLLLGLFALMRGATGSFIFQTIFFATLSLLFLTRSTYNILFFALTTLLVFLYKPLEWKRNSLAALPGIIVILVFTLKNIFLFGQISTSSWLGMNLANVAQTGISLEERQEMVSLGLVSEIVLTGPFNEISDYPESLWKPAAENCQGPDAFCQPFKQNNEPNLNFAGYIPISNQFLKDDLAALHQYPDRVVKQLMMGWRIYFSPALETVYVNTRSLAPIKSWMDVTDRFLCGNISDIYNADPCYRMQLAYFGAIFLGVGGLMIRFRTKQAGVMEKMGLLFIFLTLLYNLVVGIFFDLGENNRFRMETDPLVVIVFGYGLYHLVRWILDQLSRIFRSSLPGIT